MVKKKNESEHKGNHERWLLTYADMITLLMTFFIVMYAMSVADTSKMKKLAESLHDAFLGQGNPQMINSHAMISPKEGDALSESSDEGKVEDIRMGEVQDMLYEYIDKENLTNEVLVEMEDRGLVIRLSESMIFGSGEATIKPQALKKLVAVGKMLAGVPNYIRVEGHTDNIAVHTREFRSNWQLSSERATQVVEVLTTKCHLNPIRLCAAGYGEFRPIATNLTEGGRAQNRRVDIVLIKATFNSSEENRPANMPSL